jgi:transforming growth factor-beta-induced protein
VVPAVALSFDLAEGDQMVPTLAREMLKVDPGENIAKVTDAEGKTYSVIAADVAI